MDPKSVYGDRAEAYGESRPDYPAEVIEVVSALVPDRRRSAIADIGSGTGIFSRQLLAAGYEVFGVEPDPSMRAAAENELGAHPRFESRAGSAEDSGLATASVDLVTAAQALHWFDARRARREFRRILKPGAPVVVVWNERRRHGSAFLVELDAVVTAIAARHASDPALYEAPVERWIRPLFAADPYRIDTFRHHQVVSRRTLVARVMSSSCAPSDSHPLAPAWRRTLETLYADHAGASGVRIEYDTIVVQGHLSRARPDLS